MTQNESVINLISEGEISNFTVEAIEIGKKWDLPDIRTGAIYNLQPFKKQPYSEPEKIRITIDLIRK